MRKPRNGQAVDVYTEIDGKMVRSPGVITKFTPTTIDVHTAHFGVKTYPATQVVKRDRRLPIRTVYVHMVGPAPEKVFASLQGAQDLNVRNLEVVEFREVRKK